MADFRQPISDTSSQRPATLSVFISFYTELILTSHNQSIVNKVTCHLIPVQDQESASSPADRTHGDQGYHKKKF